MKNEKFTVKIVYRYFLKLYHAALFSFLYPEEEYFNISEDFDESTFYLLNRNFQNTAKICRENYCLQENRSVHTYVYYVYCPVSVPL